MRLRGSRTRAGAPVAVLIGVAAGAAACGGGSGSPPAASSSPPTTTASIAPGSSPVSPVTLNVCALLPGSTVSALIGQPVTTRLSSFTEVNTHKPTADCEYAFGSGDAVNVNVTPGATAADFHADAYAAGLSPTPVSGLGSEATTDATVGVHVLSGSYLVNVQGTPQQQSGDFTQEIRIAKDLIAALPH